MNQLKLFIITLFVAFANISFSNAQWTTNGTNVYNILGNVGIGSSNLYDKLTICGTSSWTGQSIKSSASYGGAYIDFYKSNGSKFGGCTMDELSNAMILRTYCCDGQVKLQTNWADRLIIDKDGKVGIGVSAPDELLTVNGTVHAKEVKIDVTGFADFVFDQNYKLMPLHQVEQFVKANSHLPEIPSFAQVSKNGVSVGELQNKLLQKIEELTLYVIEQQKELDQLKQELKK